MKMMYSCFILKIMNKFLQLANMQSPQDRVAERCLRLTRYILCMSDDSHANKVLNKVVSWFSTRMLEILDHFIRISNNGTATISYPHWKAPRTRRSKGKSRILWQLYVAPFAIEIKHLLSDYCCKLSLFVSWKNKQSSNK